MTLPNRRMGQSLGRDTVLECVIVSSPQALYYWEKDGHELRHSTVVEVVFLCIEWNSRCSLRDDKQVVELLVETTRPFLHIYDTVDD